MRKLLQVSVAGALLTAAPVRADPAPADDAPLFLRIRPNDDAAVAAQVRALREAVWARSDRRARIAIASVCTGCLKLLPPSPGGDVATTASIAEPPSAPATAGDP